MREARTVAQAVAMVEDILAGTRGQTLPLEAWLAAGNDVGRLLHKAARRRKAAASGRRGLLSA